MENASDNETQIMSSSGTKEKRVMYSKSDSSFVMIGNDTQIIQELLNNLCIRSKQIWKNS